MDGNQYLKEVKDDINLSKKLGIRGVPFFLINGKESISGAQQDKVFEKAISAALKNIVPTDTNSNGGVCLPSGQCE